MDEISDVFDLWNQNKKHIQNSFKEPHCTEGEVWWSVLGINIGTEQNGKNGLYERPVVLIYKVNYHTVWCLPLSSRFKNDRYRLSLDKIKSQVILSQIRTISTKRLLRKVTKLSDTEFNKILDFIVILLSDKKRKPAEAGNLGDPVNQNLL